MHGKGFEPLSSYEERILSASPWTRLGHPCDIYWFLFKQVNEY